MATLAGCGAETPQRGSTPRGSEGTVESITRRDAPARSGAPGGAGVPAVASVLASGSLSTPSASQRPDGAAATGAAVVVVAGAVASALAAPPAASPANAPAWRVSVRLDSGTLKTIEQSDVSALEVGQRVRLQGNHVVPR